MRHWLKAAVLGAAIALGAPAPSWADIATSSQWFASLSDKERFTLQVDLVLVGTYDRLIDGVFGQGTFDAIVGYQKRSGFSPDGVLNDVERKALKRKADATWSQLGIEEVKDDEAGLTIFLPLNLMTKTESLGSFMPDDLSAMAGNAYGAPDDQIGILTFRFAQSDVSFETLYAVMREPKKGFQPTYSAIKGDVFTVSGTDGGTGSFYARFYDNGADSSGYLLVWAERYNSVGGIIASLTASFSFPLEGEAPDTPPPEDVVPDPESTSQTISGSGFFFSGDGKVATNFHVAGNCKTIDIPGYGAAKLLKGDERNDLAAVQLIVPRKTSTAILRREPPALAEGVVLLGFPLADILDSSLNVALGIVSSESGISGEPNWFTTNAGIQPGNSGGPLLDMRGHIIGVAVARLDDARLLEDVGTTAANVGFGIKGNTLIEFLSPYNPIVGSGGAVLSPQQISSSAKQFTVQVVCEEN